MSEAKTGKFEYRAEIDGLRGIAILAVIFFHADIGFPGGFVGVDIFFVISGFLITGLILKDLNCGKFRILEFWTRRVRRILPALVVVVLSILAAGWFLFLPEDFMELGKSVIAQAFLLSNVYFWGQSGYFQPDAQVTPLLHTWSLAVEEQFYLFFPAFLIVSKRILRASFVKGIVVLFGISFCLSVYCSYYHPSANFYLLPTRAWELLIGSLLVVIPAQRMASRSLCEILSWGGMIAIFLAVFFFDHNTRFPGIAAILPCFGAAFVISGNGHGLTSLGKLLAARPIVFIGLVSYSLYLWHWPLFAFSRYLAIDPISKWHGIFLLLVSMVLAVLSWKFVETPFRKRLLLKSRVQVFSFAGFALAIQVVIGAFIWTLHGVPSRISDEARLYSSGSLSDFDKVQYLSHRVGLKQAAAGDFVELGTGDKRDHISLLVWGDSHAASVVPVLDKLCKEYGVRGVAAMYAGTAPLVGYESQGNDSLKDGSVAYNNAVIQFIQNNRIDNVILVAKWGGYITDSGTDRIRCGLMDSIRALKGVSPRIWIMRQVPRPPWTVPRTLAIGVIQGRDIEDLGVPIEEHRQEFQRQNPIFTELSTEFPSVTVLDPTEFFVNQRLLCRVADKGNALFCDQSHLSVAGAMLLRPLFVPIFTELGKKITP